LVAGFAGCSPLAFGSFFFAAFLSAGFFAAGFSAAGVSPAGAAGAGLDQAIRLAIASGHNDLPAFLKVNWRSLIARLESRSANQYLFH
jgi:hypothetical protein